MAQLLHAYPTLHLSPHVLAVIEGKTFFPNLIKPAFMDGLRAAFYVSAVLSFIAALASLLRGKKYIHGQNT
jgi:hypothetical protein